MYAMCLDLMCFLFQAQDGIRYHCVTGVQMCSLLFSSRRRHTRSLCDWSSDVISYAVFCLRSEAHTSELQSHSDLVCRLLLEKKKLHTVCPPRHWTSQSLTGYDSLGVDASARNICQPP